MSTHFASKEFVEKKPSELENKFYEVEIKISEANFKIIALMFVFQVMGLGAIFALLKTFFK